MSDTHSRTSPTPSIPQLLSDTESKERGYGPVCARHWELPWGSSTNQPIPTAFTDNLLNELFAS